MRKLCLLLVIAYVAVLSQTAKADLSPTQVQVNSSGLHDQWTDCVVDVDKHGNFWMTCDSRPQYVPAWKPGGKRIRIW